MKIVKSELSFDPEGFKGGGNGGRGGGRRNKGGGGRDDGDDNNGRGPLPDRATFADVVAGKEVFHPLSGDIAYKKGGKFWLKDGDMAGMIADQQGIEDIIEHGPVEVDADVLKDMMEEPDDPEGWQIGPAPKPDSRDIPL